MVSLFQAVGTISALSTGTLPDAAQSPGTVVSGFAELLSALMSRYGAIIPQLTENAQLSGISGTENSTPSVPQPLMLTVSPLTVSTPVTAPAGLPENVRAFRGELRIENGESDQVAIPVVVFLVNGGQQVPQVFIADQSGQDLSQIIADETGQNLSQIFAGLAGGIGALTVSIPKTSAITGNTPKGSTILSGAMDAPKNSTIAMDTSKTGAITLDTLKDIAILSGTVDTTKDSTITVNTPKDNVITVSLTILESMPEPVTANVTGNYMQVFPVLAAKEDEPALKSAGIPAADDKLSAPVVLKITLLSAPHKDETKKIQTAPAMKPDLITGSAVKVTDSIIPDSPKAQDGYVVARHALPLQAPVAGTIPQAQAQVDSPQAAGVDTTARNGETIAVMKMAGAYQSGNGTFWGYGTPFVVVTAQEGKSAADVSEAGSNSVVSGGSLPVTSNAETGGPPPVQLPPGLVSFDSSQFITSIVRQAQFLIRQGQSSAVIRLEPPSLGKLKLEISADCDIVTARMTVQSADVRDIIQNSLPQLRETLGQNGLTVHSFEVIVSQQDTSDGRSGSDMLRWQAPQSQDWTGRGPGGNAKQVDSGSVMEYRPAIGSPNSRYFDSWI